MRGEAPLPGGGGASHSLRRELGRSPHYVGRAAELAALAGSLAAAGRGDPGVTLISGEPGIGKSRLLREFGCRALNDGWLVVSRRAYDTEGMPPFLPFVEVLRQYAQVATGGELGPIVDAAPIIATLLPEAEAPIDGTPRNPDRYELFEAVSNFFVQAANATEARGLLICLDDLHWADRSTLLLFQHLARRMADARLSLTGTYRTTGLDADNPLSRILSELTRERLYEGITLAPLAAEETVALVAALTNRKTIPAPLAEALHARTKGNPFFIEELVRHLRAEGRDLDDPGLVLSDWGIPEGVRQVVGSRIARLSAEDREFLQVAAVLGDEFGQLFPAIARMLGVEASALAPAVEEAVTAGMLREDGESYRFAHALIRDTLLDGLPLARRQRLHLSAAHALETVYARNLSPWLSAVAVHCRLAGPFTDGRKAIDYAVRAGEAAERALAFDEAMAHWDAALDLMEHYGSSHEDRVGLLERLGEAAQTAGFDHYARSIAYFERALALHQRAGDDMGAAAMHARAALVMAAGSAVNDNPSAVRHLDAAAPFLRDGPPTHARLCYYSARGLLAVWQEHPRAGLEASRIGMELATELGEDDRWTSNAVMHAAHLHKLGYVSQAIQLNARAWEVADRINNPFRAYTAAAFQTTRLLKMQAPLEALPWALREADQPRQVHAPTRRSGLLGNAVDAHALSGNVDAARELARAGAARGPHMALYDGRWDSLEAGNLEALDVARQKAAPQDEAAALAWLATVYDLRGDRAGAVEALTQALAIARAAPNSLVLMSEGPALAILLALGGCDGEAAAQLAPCLEILAVGEDWRGLAGKVALAQAGIAGSAGCLEEEAVYFARAIETFRRFSLPWAEAEALTLRGQVYARHGRKHRHTAFESFSAARAILVRLSAADPWFDRLLSLEHRALGGKTLPAAGCYPDGLTPREVEVLRLLSSGLSSKEIGEELVLSVRTVERHIANLYIKTGTHGRAQATAYALAHGLGRLPSDH